MCWDQQDMSVGFLWRRWWNEMKHDDSNQYDQPYHPIHCAPTRKPIVGNDTMVNKENDNKPISEYVVYWPNEPYVGDEPNSVEQRNAHAFAYLLLAAMGVLVALGTWWVFFSHLEDGPERIRLMMNCALFVAFIIWAIFFAQ